MLDQLPIFDVPDAPAPPKPAPPPGPRARRTIPVVPKVAAVLDTVGPDRPLAGQTSIRQAVPAAVTAFLDAANERPPRATVPHGKELPRYIASDRPRRVTVAAPQAWWVRLAGACDRQRITRSDLVEAAVLWADQQ